MFTLKNARLVLLGITGAILFLAGSILGLFAVYFIMLELERC